ncbi:MAG: nucleotidyltransferase substrate binding protein [Chitinivibrionales bacterium]|nr:nucleotidyltransferase substrate binding protein [Chitinivibrionales bacterium]
MQLDLSSLEHAVASLEKAIVRSRQNPLDLEIRDSVIQRFEYTYELSWKMLKRQLEQEVASVDEIDMMNFQDLFRSGAQRGYVADPTRWFVYRRQRNITSHIYDETKAQSVYETACEFIEEAKKLLAALQARNA